MKKFTLFIASLFLTIGAMAQTYEFELIDLKSNADQMLYTNAPCTNTQWGDQFTSWQVLFDDNVGTFLHTEYANNGASADGLDHYLRVDLGAGNEISSFKFSYKTRTGSYYDFPQKFIIAGSNEENGTYTEIGRVESGLPTSTGTAWESSVFTSGTPYRYLRFMVTETNTDRKGQGVEHNYWHMGEFRLYKATPYAGYVHNTGNMNRNDRGLTSFTITDGENSLTVNSIQTSSTAPVYVDKSAQKLTTKQGATLKFTDFNYTGSWMHAYAYIDYNNDFAFNLTNNNNGEGEGEIVSYNYYDGYDITGTPANQGSAISNTYGESKAMPAFTLPKNLPAGEYRVRIKIDWNNLDADYGADDIAGNGGCQCDFTIVVEEAVGNEIAWAALNNAVDEALALFSAVTIGDGVGKYSSSIDDAVAEFLAIQEYYNSITASTPIEEIEAKTARVGEIVASFSLNMPEAGKYYRLKGNSGNYIDASSLYDKNNGQMSMKSAGECNLAGTIFYLDNESHLLNYATGTYTRNTREIGAVGDATKSVWAFSESTRTRGKYVLTDNGTAGSKNLHDNGGTRADRCSSVCGAAHDWTLEEVTELPVTVTAAGYATLYAPVALTVPTGVTAHTVTLDGEWATLSEALTVVPAETGVVLVAGEGSHNFAITTSDATAASALEGTVAATYVTDDAYVLGVVDEKVGFYTATKNQNEGAAFLNNANKAYLPKTAGMSAASYSFRFQGGATGIDNVVVENGAKAIFDLTGRRVENITAPGIYVVNGKKVLVK